MKNLPLTNNLPKIFNRNAVKSDYITMPNVASLINESNI